MLISNRGLILRPIALADLDFVVAIRNNLLIERAANSFPPFPHIREEFESNVTDHSTRMAPSEGRPNSIEFLCEVDGDPAGIGGLYGMDLYARHGELGVSLAEGSWRGQGFGELAHRMLIEYGFDDLNLRRILASVHADNTRVLRLCEKLGFQLDGIRKEYRWVNGQYMDLHLFSMNRSDYEKSRG